MSDTPSIDAIKSPPLGRGYISRYSAEHVERTLRAEIDRVSALYKSVGDDFASLRADLAAMTKERDRLTGICERLERCVAEGCTKEEADRLRADKARIDWMQSNYTDAAFIGDGEFGEGMLREAIDEVMKPTPPTL